MHAGCTVKAFATLSPSVAHRERQNRANALLSALFASACKNVLDILFTRARKCRDSFDARDSLAYVFSQTRLYSFACRYGKNHCQFITVHFIHLLRLIMSLPNFLVHVQDRSTLFFHICARIIVNLIIDGERSILFPLKLLIK